MNAVTDSTLHSLACHPQTPTEAVRGIGVRVDGATRGSLTLSFALEGDLSALRIPESRSPRRAGGLWRYTCFEAFVMAEEGPGYREFNFSPSGEWAAYAFRGYREGGELEIQPGPAITVRRSAERLELVAVIRPDCLPPGRSFRLGLSTVVETADGVVSYWALHHPPGRPDFHHSDAFTVQLELPRVRALNNLPGAGS